MKALDLIDCEYIPALYSGNTEKDHRDNSNLYLKLLKEGERNGFIPVLINKDLTYCFNVSRYGFTEEKESYSKVINFLVNKVSDTIFPVWFNRLVYNYYLDCTDNYFDYKYDLDVLFLPPNSNRYLSQFENVNTQPFSLKSIDDLNPYTNLVFVKIPVKESWKALAWIPIVAFNWCPDTFHQIALAKGLYELFDARILYIGSCDLAYYIPNPLVKREDIEQTARIMMAADQDFYQEFEYSVERIAGSHVWYMWWD